MVPPAGKVRFAGGRDVEISTLTTSGLGNYDASRTDGSAYPGGAVRSAWKSYPMTMDRGVKFSLDRMDPNDTGFVAAAENVVREFARNALVKEQDAYRIHRLYALLAADAALSKTHIVSAALTKANALGTLSGLLQTVRDDAEETEGYVALVSHRNKNAFLEAAQGTYHAVTFGNAVSVNGVPHDNVMLLDDLPCLFVPQSRMKTAISIQDGADNDGGISPAGGRRTSPPWWSTARRPWPSAAWTPSSSSAPRRTSSLTARPFRPGSSTTSLSPPAAWPPSGPW